MVNEIDTNGHVVHLTSLQALTPPEEKPPKAAPVAANGRSATAGNAVDGLSANGVLHGDGSGHG
jgi:hypothetical protein